MSNLTISNAEGAFHLKGNLDETADLTALQGQNFRGLEEIHLNMRELERCNSIGIQKILQTIQTWGETPFFYHECNQDFAYQIDMLPALLGQKRTGIVKSVIMAFECTQCEVVSKKLIGLKKLKVWAVDDHVPSIICECGKGAEMEPEDDASYSFLD